jgi:hypothetical protein
MPRKQHIIRYDQWNDSIADKIVRGFEPLTNRALSTYIFRLLMEEWGEIKMGMRVNFEMISENDSYLLQGPIRVISKPKITGPAQVLAFKARCSSLANKDQRELEKK